MARQKAVSAYERQNKEFMSALRGGQARLGEEHKDTAKYFPKCARTYYRRIEAPENFTLQEFRILAERYNFTDYQICKIIGVKYHGCTPAS